MCRCRPCSKGHKGRQGGAGKSRSATQVLNKASSGSVTLSPGTRLLREWQGQTHHVTVVERGFEYEGKVWRSLSGIARSITGTPWSGPRVLRLEDMIVLPCAVYTRKSSEEGLEQDFNSLDAQREACEAFILSQKTQGWKVAGCYDDGGFSGGNVERPGLQRLLADIKLRRVKVVVVYKVDRLTRSLADFAKMVELFDAHGVSFVSVTQQFNTTSSMGRLTLNVLLSFAQFEREVTGERIRDKIAASKTQGHVDGRLRADRLRAARADPGGRRASCAAGAGDLPAVPGAGVRATTQAGAGRPRLEDTRATRQAAWRWSSLHPRPSVPTAVQPGVRRWDLAQGCGPPGPASGDPGARRFGTRRKPSSPRTLRATAIASMRPNRACWPGC